MIQKTLISAAIVISFLSFTACESGPNASIDTAGGSISGSGANTDLSNQTGQIPLDEDETASIKDYSEADRAAYTGALQLMDEAYCSRIEDGDFKTMCITEISDKKFLEQAVEAMDAAMCEKLSTDDKSAACVIKVDVKKTEQQQEEERLRKDTEQEALAQSIVNAGDHTRCRELADPNQQEACEMNILLNKAFAENDITYCDTMSTDEGKAICRSNYEEAGTLL